MCAIIDLRDLPAGAYGAVEKVAFHYGRKLRAIFPLFSFRGIDVNFRVENNARSKGEQ